MIYGFIYKMVEDVTGHDGVKYFPYVMTLFLFILFSNLLGLLPMSFTTTSHVAVTVTLALLVFLGVTILGLVKNGIGFLGMFWVSSAPLCSLVKHRWICCSTASVCRSARRCRR